MFRSVALTESHNIRTIIPKLSAKDPTQIGITVQIEEAFKKAGSMEEWFPTEMFPDNCSSVSGLNSVMKKVGKLTSWRSRDCYSIGMCDLNIFPRLVKVIFFIGR